MSQGWMKILKHSIMNEWQIKSYLRLKKDHDNDLTKEEIDLIGSHLDKEIEDLNRYIDNEKCTKLRK